MKLSTLVTAGMIIALMAGPSLAFENQTKADSNRLVQTVSCSVNDENKQAYCMRACEESYIDASQNYAATPQSRTDNRKACETKCGC
ncbi:hypothetical protein RZS28_15940 [Methylocapsa polymorpha]|uniref:Uncharacterized protein n=1 Tax=Methylocapsa polymorpha TaxID=3080828 RepID=A0ABZ0HPR5_9HYPH|nr:hypothetical protein RZS28_15940 [Methylocapsa sp. RX1]